MAARRLPGELLNGGNTWTTTLHGGTYQDSVGFSLIEAGPEMYLMEGYTVRIYDISAIDAAADDLYTYIEYIEYDVA